MTCGHVALLDVLGGCCDHVEQLTLHVDRMLLCSIAGVFRAATSCWSVPLQLRGSESEILLLQTSQTSSVLPPIVLKAQHLVGMCSPRVWHPHAALLLQAMPLLWPILYRFSIHA